MSRHGVDHGCLVGCGCRFHEVAVDLVPLLLVVVLGVAVLR
ncbi:MULTISPECIES: hypothetical protein [unclassified Streptomyces]